MESYNKQEDRNKTAQTTATQDNITTINLALKKLVRNLQQILTAYIASDQMIGDIYTGLICTE